MNLPTFIVAAVITAIVLAIVLTGIRNRKAGKGGCSCGGDCGSCSGCH